MRRREFITLLGGAAAWPLRARAQQPRKLPTIGFLGATTPLLQTQWTAAFVQRLGELGWIEGRTVAIEFRLGGGKQGTLRPDHCWVFAAQGRCDCHDVILTEGTPGLAAALQATKSIPIIFASVTDPVGQGLVANLARPGGNATGFTAFEFSMGSKWVEILRELVPSVKHIGLLFNPAMAPYSELYLQAIRAAAETFKIDTNSIPVADNAYFKTGSPRRTVIFWLLKFPSAGYRRFIHFVSMFRVAV
jgi:ABC transporter substrate binding protein